MTNSSPYGVSEQLQQILARKRDEARQQMLDQIGMENIQSQIQSRADQAATNAAYRKELGERADAQTQERLANIDNQKRRQEAIQQFLNSPDFAKLPPQEQAVYKMFAAGGDKDDSLLGVLANRWLQPKKESGKIIYANEADQKSYYNGQLYTGEVGPNDKVINVPRPPREPRDSGSYLGPATDQAGKPIPGKAYIMQNGKIALVDLPGESSIGPKVPQKPQSVITPTEAVALSKARGKATPKKVFGFSINPNDTDVAAYNSLVDTTIAKYPTSPNVKDLVRRAIKEQGPDTSNDEIVQGVLGEGLITPEEAPQFKELLGLSRPE